MSLHAFCFTHLPTTPSFYGGHGVRLRPTLRTRNLSNGLSCNSTAARRSANYQPTVWSYDFLQRLENGFKLKGDMITAEELKREVRLVLDREHEPLEQLELIDALQRLGLAYHFQFEISSILQSFCSNRDEKWEKQQLHAVALQFRLLRQHGLDVSQDIFKKFLDKKGHFKAEVCSDIKGMLSLYEASYYSLEEENIMEEAWNFTTKHLKEYLDCNAVLDDLGMQVQHALELPLHWRAPRAEARWYIDHVSKNIKRIDAALVNFAKFEFNYVQGTHQEELKELSRWWNNAGLADISFARDRLVLSYVYPLEMAFEPQFRVFRRILTLSIAIIAVIDDIFDVYGTLEELELCTEAVESWEISQIRELPDYMKTCFSVLYDFINEMAAEIFKKQGFHALPHLKKMWVGLVRSYLVEAKWYHSGYKPTLEEYLDNACVSIATSLIAVEAYLLSEKKIDKVALEFLENSSGIIYLSSLIFRLQDDLATSSDEMKRGDVPKAIQCYMEETGTCEAVAREKIRDMMRKAWKKVNYHRVAHSPLPQECTEAVLNFVRVAHRLYLHGDNYGVREQNVKDLVSSLLMTPLPL